MSTITVARPLKVETPRGAHIAAMLALRLLGWFEVGARSFAKRRQQSARVSEANALRRLARQHAASEPGVAAEMFSAADRHELMN